jgi:Helix-turn-helix domain
VTLKDSVRRHRLAILQRAALLSNVTPACHEAGISRTVFYRWRQRFLRYGPDGLLPRPTRPTRWPRQAVPRPRACGAGLYAAVAHARACSDCRSTAPSTPGGLAGQRLRRVRDPQAAWLAGSVGAADAAGGSGRDRRVGDGADAPAPDASAVEAQQPGHLVCLYAFYIGKLKGVGKVWQLTACDAACSYAVATLVDRVTSRTTEQFLRAHVVPLFQRAGSRSAPS